MTTTTATLTSACILFWNDVVYRIELCFTPGTAASRHRLKVRPVVISSQSMKECGLIYMHMLRIQTFAAV